MALKKASSGIKGKPPVDDITKLIDQREQTHGDFRLVAEVSQRLKCVLRDYELWQSLRPIQQEALEAICGKIGRILAGDADFADHWLDCSGYAMLVVKELGQRR